ncbi:MAG: ABC transporter permease subunit [Ardenticatenaceae bacterium]|nr:ABC transporter permease subunit [Anaerolineales bacterium]MCB8920126.1 ABC transporter permease subunit [Ardenticatenaceae bacterium]MCB8992188.1 ABC transporter permease subunit [Ardenticatenaceae bacterium]MCB9005081.1 ABC transporter permease subunit [Ardenticatenaceae bacterium]
MDKIKTIVFKEWAEVFKNRLVLFTVIFLPLIMVALPLGTLAAMGNWNDELSQTSNDVPDEFFGELCEGLSEMDCAQVYMLDLFTLMLMILPVTIPVTIAAYSIVGEKTSHSLEPLLATPITTGELVMGKTIAAVIPAIAATWLSFAIYLVGARLMVTDTIFAYLVDPLWLIAIFVDSPLLTLMSVAIALMVSSRVSDPRVAEQLSAVVVLPLIMLIVGQSVGFILIDQTIIMILGVVVGVLDVVLLYFSVKVFQRETILTRWK